MRSNGGRGAFSFFEKIFFGMTSSDRVEMVGWRGRSGAKG